MSEVADHDGDRNSDKNATPPPHLSENLPEEVASMWEIPQMYQFMCLAKETLGIHQLSMYEMERMLLMPKASKQLGSIMTSLLCPPMTKSKLRTMPPMPYQFWSNLLTQKALTWFKLYQSKDGDTVKVLETIGVEPEFWKIFPEPELISERKFDKLCLRERVWLLKTVCDTLIHSRRTLQEEIVRNYLDDDNEMVLGKDRHGASYIYFPIFLDNDLRIYRHCLNNKILLGYRTAKKEAKPKSEVVEKKMVKRKRKSWRNGKLPTKSRKKKVRFDKEKAECGRERSEEQEDKGDDKKEVEDVEEKKNEENEEEMGHKDPETGENEEIKSSGQSKDEGEMEKENVPSPVAGDPVDPVDMVDPVDPVDPVEPSEAEAKDDLPQTEEQEMQSLRDDVSNCSKTDDEKINEKRAASPGVSKSCLEKSKSDDEKIIETKSPGEDKMDESVNPENEAEKEDCERTREEGEASVRMENTSQECIPETTANNADDSNTRDTELRPETTSAATKAEIEEFKRMVTALGESNFRLVADSLDALRDLAECFRAQNYPEGPVSHVHWLFSILFY